PELKFRAILTGLNKSYHSWTARNEGSGLSGWLSFFGMRGLGNGRKIGNFIGTVGSAIYSGSIFLEISRWNNKIAVVFLKKI
ncbi:MAG: hypothetical protein AAGU02_07835, partial [Lawsonibacter sp.]